jgi:hypothetical protein
MSGINIKDATGAGYGAKVDDQNRLKTLSISETEQFHINRDNGKVWSLPFENITNTGANDYIFYLKNTGDKDLAVPKIRLSASAATQVEIHIVTGTAGGGGSAVTPVSRNLGSSQSPSATVETDPDITGLTTGGTLFLMQCPVANTQYELDTTSNIVIPKGKAIAILIETTTITMSGVVTLIEEE